MAKITRYILSDIADRDLSEIYDYTFSAHGRDQAISYLTGLEEALELLIEQPKLGRLRPEIRGGLFAYIHEKHTIFYRIMTNHIRVVRVLHTRRDIPKFFL